MAAFLLGKKAHEVIHNPLFDLKICCIIESHTMKFKKHPILLLILSFLSVFVLATPARATTVASVVPSVAVVKDVHVGQIFSISVKFDGPMDITTDPTVLLSPDLVTMGTLSFSGTSWSPDGTTYTIDYVVADQNELISSVDATILGGIDTSVPATPVPTHTATGLFSVDTFTPPDPETVVSVVPSTAVVNEGVTNFSIAVTFSGAMDTAYDPTITLSPDLYTSGTLSFVGTSWSAGNTVYTMDFTVADLDEEYASVDATVIGAFDARVPPGPAPAYTATSLFAVDTKAPTVTPAHISVSGSTGNGGVFKIGDTITVTWDATASGDAVSDAASMSVDFSPFGGPSNSIASANAGIWTATYLVPEGTIDAVGGLNPVVSVIDGSGNMTTVTDDADAMLDNQINGYGVSIDQVRINTANQTNLSFTFSNAEIGAVYDYALGGPVAGTGTVSSANETISNIDVSALADGTLSLSVYLNDAAGNIGNPVTATVDKDATPPAVSTTLSQPAITLGTAGTDLIVTLLFDEPMDAGFAPSVAFSPDIISSGTLSLSSEGWLDTMTYTLTYDTSAVSEKQSSVDVTVSGAKDMAGNSMADDTDSSVLSVDTVPPPKKSSSGGGGGGGRTNDTSEIPGFTEPQISPIPTETTIPRETTPSQTVTFTQSPSPAGSRSPAGQLITPEETAPVLAGVPSQLPDIRELLPQSETAAPRANTLAASSALAGLDLLTGKNLYISLIILLCLIVLGRVGYLLARGKHA